MNGPAGHGQDRHDVLSVRPLVMGDVDAMVGVLADPSLYHFTGGEPPTREDLEARYALQVRGISPDGGEVWMNLVVVVDSAPVGYVQATIPVDDDVAEVAWVIGRSWQGRGYATEGAKLLMKELASRGVRRVTAFIHPEHLASQRVAENLGMRKGSEMVDGEVRWTGVVG